MDVNWRESITRNISLKFLPVEAGYVIINFTFLSGEITITDLTVNLSEAFGWTKSYNFERLKIGSAIIGKLTSVFWVLLGSFNYFFLIINTLLIWML